jgi:hypothetical protein
MIHAWIPHHSNVHIQNQPSTSGPGALISVSDYLEGDLSIKAHGDIIVSKVRGKKVSLETQVGHLRVEKKIEAMELVLSSRCGDISAPKLLSDSMKVELQHGNMQVSSAFVEIGSLTLGDGTVQLNGYHGTLKLEQSSSDPNAGNLIRGVNGKLEGVLASKSTIQFDALFLQSSSHISCDGDLVLALPADQTVKTILTSETKRPELPDEAVVDNADLNCESPKAITATFQGKQELNRATHRSSGKINIEEASKVSNLWGQPCNNSDHQMGEPGLNLATQFGVVTSKASSIKVEVLGWKERIRRRFLE